MNEQQIKKDGVPSKVRNQKSGEALYLFCLARGASLPIPMEGNGVDNQHPLFLQNFRDIVAVLSMTSLKEFCGPEAESKMKDLEWMGPRVCRHEATIEQVMRHSPVLPVRYGTIFSSLESMDKFLWIHYHAIARFLDKVADKEEWGVKVLLDRAKAREKLVATMVAGRQKDLARLSAGKRYFEEQRIRTEANKELTGWLRKVCKEIVDDLNRQVSDFRERRMVTHDFAKGDLKAIRNWAFLTPRKDAADFWAQVDRLNRVHAQEGLVIERSGPWPPYSFCPSLSEDR